MIQKASSSDKVTILSLEAKIVELKGKLKDIDLEHIYYDLNVMGGMIEELAQISSSKIESLRLELEWANEDLNSKKHEIECMEKGKELSNSMYKQKIDILSLG